MPLYRDGTAAAAALLFGVGGRLFGGSDGVGEGDNFYAKMDGIC